MMIDDDDNDDDDDDDNNDDDCDATTATCFVCRHAHRVQFADMLSMVCTDSKHLHCADDSWTVHWKNMHEDPTHAHRRRVMVSWLLRTL